MQAGRLRLPTGAWRERNPWLAFEDGYRSVRAFLQRLEGGSAGPLQARFGEDLRALIDGTAMVSVRVATASAYRNLTAEARDAAAISVRPGVRLAIAQPPLRPSVDRLAYAYIATGWVLGREASALLPLEALFGATGRAPWSWQSAALGRSLAAVEPMLARDGRVVLLCDPGAEEAVIGAVLGGISAGYRLGSRSPGRAGRGRGHRRAHPARRDAAAGSPDAGQRLAAADARRRWRPGCSAGARPVRPAGAVRGSAVLDGRGRAECHRGSRRRPQGARRAGPDGATARRDPRRARPGRSPPSARGGQRCRPGLRTSDARDGHSGDRAGRWTIAVAGSGPGPIVPVGRRRQLSGQGSPSKLRRCPSRPPASPDRSTGAVGTSIARGRRRGRPGRSPSRPHPRRADAGPTSVASVEIEPGPLVARRQGGS